MYKVMTNATYDGAPVWAKPGGAYGVARCINWRADGAPYTAIRWGY